ncbi:hypothetical protein HDU76_008655, partial [Blyttiomyces sp. JEL0837]
MLPFSQTLIDGWNLVTALLTHDVIGAIIDVWMQRAFRTGLETVSSEAAHAPTETESQTAEATNPSIPTAATSPTSITPPTAGPHVGLVLITICKCKTLQDLLVLESTLDSIYAHDLFSDNAPSNLAETITKPGVAHL